MKISTSNTLPANHDISIWIDTYDDIFSDFDPRNYSQRNISDDFMQELRKVANENLSAVRTLHLLVPKEHRNAEHEIVIEKRIHQHFQTTFRIFDLRRNTLRKKSYLFLLSGMTLALTAGYFSFLKVEYPLMNIPFVILEPGGWFLIWTSFENFMRSSRKAIPDLQFFSKLKKCKIVFENI